jgi:chromosome segregation ATPase
MEQLQQQVASEREKRRDYESRLSEAERQLGQFQGDQKMATAEAKRAQEVAAGVKQRVEETLKAQQQQLTNAAGDQRKLQQQVSALASGAGASTSNPAASATARAAAEAASAA